MLRAGFRWYLALALVLGLSPRVEFNRLVLF